MELEVDFLKIQATTPDPYQCTLFDEQKKCDIIVAVKRVVASFSIIGCLLMIGVIWLFRKYIFFVQRLILCLSIAALFDSIALMGDMHPDGPWCEFQAWMLSFFDWAVLLWVCCITFNLYYNVIKMKSSEKFEILYHVISWGFPLFISLLPFIGDHYGPAGAWCWINGSGETYWRFFTWFGPLFVIIIIMFAVYSYLTYRLNQRVRTWEGTYDPDVEHSKELLKQDIKPLKAYPFIYLVLSIFPLINRIQNAANPDNPVFGLVLLHAICSPLQGVFNAIAYGLDKETISRLSWPQINNAFKSKFSSKAVIGEYNIDDPSANDDQAPVKDENMEVESKDSPDSEENQEGQWSSVNLQKD
ncbi:cyclic AMP receptor-like protein A isoform X2 [Anneissia japonica]|uniref:cyclic AMP receptor-like protein A isoform X2 n=1 Tax=Anneissia japonica TaxID=1529436 RepID=UPI00142563C8|nr:cyclic AMP receptor-like protein A isoform X2 [Anneissia japonica]